jgi:ketose-bisphosphate aldolase
MSMALHPMSRLLTHARDHRYAVGYFEAGNLESVLAAKDAAEELDSPVIIGFNGGFIGNPARKVPENVRHYGALGRAIAEAASVPMSLILNEADDVQLLVDALEAGFNVVMHDHERCTVAESMEINRYLATTAHAVGAEVEAELGELPAADSRTHRVTEGQTTDPDEAVRFVEQTGVDALAVAVGNIHMLEGRKAALDLELVRELADRVPVPLVLHGGTGIDDEELRQAILLGIAKINVGTLLRRTFINSLRSYFHGRDVDCLDLNEVTSTGGRDDMLVATRAAMCREIARLMKVFGSDGMASRFLARAPKR